MITKWKPLLTTSVYELNYKLKLQTRNENAKESVCMKTRQVSELRNYFEHNKGWICKGRREDEAKFCLWTDAYMFPSEIGVL